MASLSTAAIRSDERERARCAHGVRFVSVENPTERDFHRRVTLSHLSWWLAAVRTGGGLAYACLMLPRV
jgi:hypothetical protein